MRKLPPMSLAGCKPEDTFLNGSKITSNFRVIFSRNTVVKECLAISISSKAAADSGVVRASIVFITLLEQSSPPTISQRNSLVHKYVRTFKFSYGSSILEFHAQRHV